jgi:hypothetical protein
MTGFTTQTEAVQAHGKSLSTQITDSLDEAVQAAQSVTLGPEVMGVICQMYTFVFQGEMDDAKEMLSALPKAMDSTGTRLQRAASMYDGTEQGTKNTFEGK